MKDEKKILDAMESDIMKANIPESEKSKLMKNFLHLKEQKINLMITGATGCGKSSTINALFDMEVAKVGVGVDPETMEIEKYDLGNLILWDSPGLGDGKEADERHAKNIINKLHEKDSSGNLLIDLVLVILDGSTRDLGTSYDLINEIIVPNLGRDKKNRILVAINQADMAMKGKGWNEKENKPKPELEDFLNKKVESVKKRIKEGTGIDIEPIYYKAGFKEEGMLQERPYNLSKLFYYILKFTPKEKRLVYIDNINQSEEPFKDNDNKKDYGEEIIDELQDTIEEYALQGADIGENILGIFGEAGEKAGRVIGSAVGKVVGLIKGTSNIQKEKRRRRGCFITTATCEAYGKPDDCYELTLFRRFRDDWLLKEPDGTQLVEQYYDTAPEIVDLINKQNNRDAIYKCINDNYLTKCLHYIEKGDNQNCKNTYIDMMDYLYGEQKKWQ